MRYARIAGLAGLVLVLAVGLHRPGVSAADDPAAEDAGSAALVHVVLFDLKETAPADEAEMLVEDGHKLLAEVPTVRRVYTGPPASEASSTVKDYDVGLYCEFDDEAGLATYIAHPLHIQYVQKHRQHWANVRVIDFTSK